jgi:hypothetical protein
MVMGSSPYEVDGFFSIYLVLPAALGPGVQSTPDMQKNNVSGE